VQHFRRHLRLRGDRNALHFRAGGRWTPVTWTQFGEAARRITAFLIAEGCVEQDHVAIWSGNRPEWHIADMAVMSGRMITVPVYQSLSAVQGQYALAHSNTRVCFVDTAGTLERILSTRDQLPLLRRVVVIDATALLPDDGFSIAWQQALSAGQQHMDAHGDQELERRVAAISADDVCTLIYTSGTTGPPRAVQISHRNVAAGTAAAASFLPAATEDDRILSYLPLAHVAERMISEFHSYIFGNATWFLDAGGNLPACLREVRPTLFFGVPRVWEKMHAGVLAGIDAAPPLRRLVARRAIRVGEAVARLAIDGRQPGAALRRRHARAERFVFRRLRFQLGLDRATVLASGAAPIAPAVLVFFRAIGMEICEIYGMTETCGCCCMTRPGHSRPGTVGPPIPGVAIRLAVDGEVLCRGGVVTAGYENDPEATAQAIDSDGWLHTGDVGTIDAEGVLSITDRKKDLIITAAGKNVAPANIEALLADGALIANAVIIGDRRPYVTALLTLDPEALADFARRTGIDGPPPALAGDSRVLGSVRRHIDQVNTNLNHAEQVKRFVVLPLPFAVGEELTPTLKVKRRMVAERYAAEIDGMYSLAIGEGG
jgi:long-chain acyl-CoA synthetase